MMKTRLIYRYVSTLILIFTASSVWAEGQTRAALSANLQLHEIHIAKSLQPLNRRALSKSLGMTATKRPQPLTRAEMQRAIKQAGQLSGKVSGDLKLNAGPVAVLTPDQPIGKGSLMVLCGNYLPTGFLDSTPRIIIYDRDAIPECGIASGVGIEFEELTTGKTYLVDIAVYQQSGTFEIDGAVELTVKPVNGHILLAFTETSTKSGFMLTYKKATVGRKSAFFYSASLFEVD